MKNGRLLSSGGRSKRRCSIGRETINGRSATQ
jgi:hypothetical protein